MTDKFIRVQEYRAALNGLIQARCLSREWTGSRAAINDGLEQARAAMTRASLLVPFPLNNALELSLVDQIDTMVTHGIDPEQLDMLIDSVGELVQETRA